MADWGMKVSRDGFDVKTCDKKDLVMSSDHNMLKTQSVQSLDSGNSYSHGLGYTPLFFATILFSPGKRSLVGDTSISSPFQLSICYGNSTSVTNSTLTDSAKFYIFYNQ